MKKENRSSGLHGRVVNELGRRIVSGEFPAGAHLPNQGECCDLVGASRSVLREALRVLAAKGMVEARPKAGTFIRPRADWNFLDADILEWSLETPEAINVLRHLYELRHMVEPVTASMAAKRAKLEDFIAIGKAYEEMAASHYDHRIIEPDLRFHRAIIAASGNEVFVSLGKVIESTLKIAFHIGSRNTQSQQESLDMHKAVLDAIVERDSSAARAAMETLIEYSQETVISIHASSEKQSRDKGEDDSASRRKVGT